MGDNSYVSLRADFHKWLLDNAGRKDSGLDAKEIEKLSDKEAISKYAAEFKEFLADSKLGSEEDFCKSTINMEDNENNMLDDLFDDYASGLEVGSEGFNQLDADGDGEITTAERQAFYSSISDNDGNFTNISLDDFTSAISEFDSLPEEGISGEDSAINPETDLPEEVDEAENPEEVDEAEDPEEAEKEDNPWEDYEWGKNAEQQQTPAAGGASPTPEASEEPKEENDDDDKAEGVDEKGSTEETKQTDEASTPDNAQSPAGAQTPATDSSTPTNENTQSPEDKLEALTDQFNDEISSESGFIAANYKPEASKINSNPQTVEEAQQSFDTASGIANNKGAAYENAKAATGAAEQNYADAQSAYDEAVDKLGEEEKALLQEQQTKVDDLTSQVDEKKSAVAKEDATIREADMQINTCEIAISDTTNQIQANDTLISQLSALPADDPQRAQIAELETQNAQLELQLQSLEKQRDAAQGIKDGATERKATVEEGLAGLEEQKAQAEEELARIQQEIDEKYGTELVKLQEAVTNASNALDDARTAEAQAHQAFMDASLVANTINLRGQALAQKEGVAWNPGAPKTYQV